MLEEPTMELNSHVWYEDSTIEKEKLDRMCEKTTPRKLYFKLQFPQEQYYIIPEGQALVIKYNNKHIYVVQRNEKFIAFMFE